MPIIQSDLYYKRAANNDDNLNTCGGVLTQTDIGSNLFPDVNGQERIDGVTRFRKFFLTNLNNLNSPLLTGYTGLKLYSGKVFLKQVSPGGSPAMSEFVQLKAGTPTDTPATHGAGWQAAGTGWAGVGYLATNPCEEIAPVDYVAVNKTSMLVRVDGAYVAGDFFYPGQIIITDDAGKTQFLTVSSVDSVVDPLGLNNLIRLNFPTTPTNFQFSREWNDAVYVNDANNTDETHIGAANITFPTNGSPLLQRLVLVTSGTGINQIRRVISYTAAKLELEYAWTIIPPAGSSFVVLKTMVSMCVPVGDIQAAILTPPGFGKPPGKTFNEQYLKLYPMGCIDSAWTITALDSGPTTVTVFSAALNKLLVCPSTGTTVWPVANEIKPANENGLSYYFRIPPVGDVGGSCWPGSGWVVGEALTFTTVSSSAGAWAKQTVLPGCNAHLNNSWELGCSGDTV